MIQTRTMIGKPDCFSLNTFLPCYYQENEYDIWCPALLDKQWIQVNNGHTVVLNVF